MLNCIEKRKGNRRGSLVMVIFITAVLVNFLLFGVNARGVEKNIENPPRYKYYTSIEIRPGDSLWSIAEGLSERYGLDVWDCIEELKMMNSLEQTDAIHAGNYLTVFYFSDEYK